MSRVNKTKTGNHSWYVGATKIAEMDSNTALGQLAGMQSVQDAGAGKPSYRFTANTQNITHTSINMASSDLTIIMSGTFSTENQYFYRLYVDSSNAISFGHIAGFFLTQNAASVTSTYTASGKPQSICVQRTSTQVQFFNNGVAETAFTQAKQTLTGTQTFSGIGFTANSLSNSSLSRVLAFNYALSADKIARYSAGAKLDFEDIGGSMATKIINDDFASATGWTIDGTGSAISGGQATFGYGVNVSLSQSNANWVSGYTGGKRYRVTYTVVSNSLAGGSPVFQLGNNYYSGAEVIGASTVVLPMTVGTWSVEFTCSNYASILYFRMYIQGTTTSGAMVIDNVSVIQLGAILDLEPESMTPSIWHDESGNQLDGVVTGAQLVNIPHFAYTDYGPAAVKQELLDSSMGAGYYFNSASAKITGGSVSLGSSPVTCLMSMAHNTTSHTAARYFLLLGTPSSGSNGRLISDFGGYIMFSHGDQSTASQRVVFQSVLDTSPHTYVGISDNGSLKAYLDGVFVDTKASGVTVTANPTGPVAIGDGVTNLAANIYRTVVFNYVLSEDKIRRYSAGAKLDYEDVGGNMTDLLPTIGTWVVVNYDSFTASGRGPLTAVETGGQNCSAKAPDTNVFSIVTGKKYRLTYTLVQTSGVSPNVVLVNSSYTAKTDVKTLTVGSSVFVDFTALASDFVVPYFSSSGNTNYTLTISSIVQLGAILDLEPEGIGEGTWVDSSPNHVNVDVIGALASFPQDENPTQSTWTPTITAGNNMTKPGSATITNAKYRVNNGICYFEFRLSGLSITATNTASSFSFTVPVPTRNNTGYANGTVHVYGSSGEDYGVIVDLASSERATISGSFRSIGCATGAVSTIDVSGWYFI